MNTENTQVLAFIGDAVYELYVRERVALSGEQRPDRLHRMAEEFVRAESQAYAVKKLMEGFLTEDELALVKRARNHKTPNRSRSAGPLEYKLATAFEALLGWLRENGQEERLAEVMKRAADITEVKGQAADFAAGKA
ncbi:MAG: ribonuclease III [Eubacterium sp.]|nr:ribonuclease III [Eubacterium sp.]